MGRDLELPKSVSLHLRVDTDAMEILRWYTKTLGVPLSTYLRAACEDAADVILEAHNAQLPASAPEDVLFKRLAYRLRLRELPHVERSDNPRDNSCTP